MNITSIRLYSHSLPLIPSHNPYIEFPLVDFDLGAPYIIKGATGLESPELIGSDTNHSPATNFGALKHRTVQLMIKLNPVNNVGKSPGQLREDLYRIITSQDVENVIALKFMDGITVVGTIRGSITRLEANPFSLGQDVIITIDCDDPLIKAEEPEDVRSIWIPNLSFPGVYEINDTKSTAPHGIELLVEWTSVTPAHFRFQFTTPFDVITRPFEIEWDFELGDKIYINSQFKQVEITRRYTELSVDYEVGLANHIKAGSILPAIYPYQNWIQFDDPDKFDILLFNHIPTYWGI